MAITPLPKAANLENLKKRAKTLLKKVKANDADALALVGPYFGDPAQISLQQAHLVIARSHGFSSWSKLKHHIEHETQQGLSPEQLANQFLDLVTVCYGTTTDLGPHRFTAAQELLDAHPDIRSHSIYTAAAIGDVAQIDRWLDQQPDLIDQRGGYFHWTALMYATYARLPDSSSLNGALRLIARGANPNAHYMWGGQYKFTALTGAFGHGENGPVRQPKHPDDITLAAALLQAGADPNDGQAAYNRAFDEDNACLELLLDYGLRPSDKNNWLIEQDQKLIPSPSDTMHFHLIRSIHSGKISRAQLLIDHGVDLERFDDTYQSRTFGKSPYHTALLLGQTEIAQALLHAGAKDIPLDPEQAFEAACMGADLNAAQQVIEDQPDILSRINTYELLCDAAKLGNLGALDVMIALGFDVNQYEGRTALHEAALSGSVAATQRLLEAGADPKIRDMGHQMPPIGFAQYVGNDEIVAVLDEADMDLFTAAARGRLPQIKAALARHPEDLNLRFSSIRRGDAPSQNDWMTPICYAILNGHTNVVTLLLEGGADTGITAADGTDLCALAKDRPEVLDLLAPFSPG